MVMLAGCGTPSPVSRAAQKSRSTTTIAGLRRPTSTTLTTAPALAPTTVPAIGGRTFSVTGVTLADGNWLTVGLHPTTAPVQLHAVAEAQLEVCPAGLDGSLTNSSWPSFVKFPSCLLMNEGQAMLPPTDGNTHVAFAVKAVTGRGVIALALTVTYEATDTFVEVIPPSARSTALSFVYTPLSSTTSVTVSPAGLVSSAPGYTVDISQAGGYLSQPEPCDFPTEADGCVGPVNPGQPVDVHIAGPGSNVVIYPSWR